MRQIFTSYAAADMDIDAQAAQDSVNLTELMYMLTEGKPTRIQPYPLTLTLTLPLPPPLPLTLSPALPLALPRAPTLTQAS